MYVQLPPFERQRGQKTLHLHLALRFDTAQAADQFEHDLPALRAGLLQTVDTLDNDTFNAANAVTMHQKISEGLIKSLPKLKAENILVVDCYSETAAETNNASEPAE